MSINANVDGVAYEGIEKITAGGKTVELSEVYSGTKVITSNGTHDVSGYAEAVVEVPAQGTTVEGSIEITENGSHDVSRYATAVVNVAQETEGYSVDDCCEGTFGNTLFYKANVVTNVTSIREYAFAGTYNAKHVTANSATELNGYAAFGNAQLTELVAPNLTKMGRGAFSGCTSLLKADYPLCTTAHNDNHFNGCTKLAEVNLPLLTGITQSMFSNCKALASISLPSATRMGTGAFQNCTSLSSVNLPALTGKVTQNAFNGCTSLEEITLPLTGGLEVAACFAGCTALKKVDLGVNATTLKGTNVFQNCTALETVILRYDGVVTANNGVFAPSANGVTVYVPSAQLAAYQADSMWSTQGKVTFASIEGSDYE